MKEDTEETIYHLLVLAADDDVAEFAHTVRAHGANLNELSSWYHRHYALQKMGSHEVTPTILASLYGSLNVLKFILSHISSHDRIVNMTCSIDKATPLHYAAAGCSLQALDTVKLLLEHGADVNAVDAHGLRPVDVMRASYKQCHEKLEMEKLLMLNGITGSITSSSQTSAAGRSLLQVEEILEDIWASHSFKGNLYIPQFDSLSPVSSTSEAPPQESPDKTKESLVEPSFADVKHSIYTSDDFRMFSFKVRPCSRAYSHDWTECPFVHNGENARRRDPRKFHYSCVPCPDFRKGACRLGDACEYAHGIFESWLHPAQYRTRLCKDGVACTRRVCFFAHAKDELRPLYIATGSAVPSSRGSCVYNTSAPHGPALASSLGFASSPSSQLQQSQKNCSPKLAWSPELMVEGSWIPKDLPTLHLPHAGSFHGSPLRNRPLNARDSCMPKESPKFSLKSQLKIDEGFKLEDLCAGVDVKANHESLSMSPINHADHVFSEGTSPPSPLLPQHMPSLLSTPWRMHTQSNMNTLPQEWTHLKTLLPLAIPSQGCSPVHSHPNSKAQVLTLSKGAATHCIGAPMHCSASVIEAQKNESQSFPNVGSPMGVCPVEIERFNVHMSSEKRSSCPIAMDSSQTQRFLMSDWGSPTGKLEWGVQKEDLHRLRRLTAHGQNVIECPIFCGASLNLSSEGSYNMNSELGDSVLGFWLEQMQLDEIMT